MEELLHSIEFRETISLITLFACLFYFLTYFLIRKSKFRLTLNLSYFVILLILTILTISSKNSLEKNMKRLSIKCQAIEDLPIISFDVNQESIFYLEGHYIKSYIDGPDDKIFNMTCNKAHSEILKAINKNDRGFVLFLESQR